MPVPSVTGPTKAPFNPSHSLISVDPVASVELSGEKATTGRLSWPAVSAFHEVRGVHDPDCQRWTEVNCPPVAKTPPFGANAALQSPSTDGVVNALLRHDWLDRLEQVMRIAGLPPTARMQARSSRLRASADAVRAAGVS